MADPSTPEAEQKSFSLLASEVFPNSFHGEVKQPEPEAAALEPTEEIPENQELTPEETPAEPEQTPGETPEEQEEIPISSLSDLIQAQEFDPEWFDSLEVEVKVDGNPSKASLADLRKSYQMTEAAEKRLNDAKEKAKTQNQVLADKQEQADASLQVAARLIEKAEKLFTAENENVDWAGLEKHDLAQFTAKKMKLQERQGEINQMKQDAMAEYQAAKKSMKEEFAKTRQEALVAENVALLDKVPEWNDPEIRKKEDAEIGEYLTKQGFTPEDIANASDHRLIVMARKAMRFDAAKKADPAKKKLVKVPKMMKSGTPKSQDQINRDELQKARERLKRTGDIKDAMAVRRLEKGN